MMKLSVLMNCMIPLMCHFMFARGVTNSTEFLLSVYDVLIDLYDVDIYNKLYETAISNVLRTAKRNQAIWNMQDIRGINTSIHSLQSVQNVLINIMPKYRYDGNLVHLNYKSILRNTGFQVLDIEYEFSFVSLSSSRRDEDLNSEFDKFESIEEMAPCYRNIASKPLELLGNPNAHLPIWRRKSETSYRMVYGEILRINKQWTISS